MNREKKQEILVQNILDKVGGKKNIKFAYHCATRLRMTLFDDNIVVLDEIKSITNIKGALYSNGELQIIIGAEVPQITSLLNDIIKKSDNKDSDMKTDFELKMFTQKEKVSFWRRGLKAVSSIFGPLIPFLIGVGLIMATQQLLFRAKLITIPDDSMTYGVDYNLFDQILNVIANSGFKLMGVIAMWSTVKYLGGNTVIAIALGLFMVSPLLPDDGISMATIGSWDIKLKPYYSTILAFIAMGIVVAYMQKFMTKYLNPVANFLLNPFLTLLLGGLIAFFIMGPIMGVVENAMLNAFDWFMNMPFGIGTLIVGLTWQPLVVLGVHNVLFLAATADLTNNNNPSLFLAAAFAAAWAQMGAAIGVGLRSRKTVDKTTAFAAALPGIISGPTESCIYGVNLPKGLPFLTGVLAGGIGGWLIGMFGVKLDSLAGLGGIVGFLAYNHKLGLAIAIDLASLALGILITYLLYSETKTEKTLAKKTFKKLNNNEFLNSKNDFNAMKLKKIIKKIKKDSDRDEIIKTISEFKSDLIKLKPELNEIVDKYIDDLKSENKSSNSKVNLIKEIANLKSERQIELNKLDEELKVKIKELSDLNPITKKYLKIVVREKNLDYSLNKILEIKEERDSKNFNKYQELINSKNKLKIEKANEMLKSNDKNDYKADKISSLRVKIEESKKVILDYEKTMLETTEKYYNEILKIVEKLEKISNVKYDSYKIFFWNDIHNVEIQEKILVPKIL